MTQITCSAFEDEVWKLEGVRLTIIRTTGNYVGPTSMPSYAAHYTKAIPGERRISQLAARINKIAPRIAFRVIKGDGMVLGGGTMYLSNLRATYKDLSCLS